MPTKKCIYFQIFRQDLYADAGARVKHLAKKAATQITTPKALFQSR